MENKISAGPVNGHPAAIGYQRDLMAYLWDHDRLYTTLAYQCYCIDNGVNDDRV
jgi:hypothetical protein